MTEENTPEPIVPERTTLGDYIRRHRREKRMSVRELADKAKLSYFYVSKLENDQQEPAVDALIKLASALDAPLGEMLALSEGETAALLENLLERHRIPEGLRAARGTGIDVGDRQALLAELRNWPPSLLSALANLVGASVDDAERLAEALNSLVRLSPEDRRRWIRLITTYAADEEGDRT